MKNIFTSIKMFLILLLLPSYSLHAQAVTYPVSKPGIPDQPYVISCSDDAMAPFSDAVPSDNSPVAPAPRRSGISIGGDLGDAGMGGEDENGEGANASPIGAPWVLLLLAVGYAAFKFYGRRRLAMETANESNMKNTSIMKKINDKIRSSFSTRIAAVLLMLITMSVNVWGRTIYFVNTNNWSTIKCHHWGGRTAGTSWPGSDVTVNTGKSYSGGSIFSIDIPDDRTNCIFNNGSGTQTADLTINDETPVYVYNTGWKTKGEVGLVDYVVPDELCVETSGNGTVFFRNTAGWTKVYCYAWSGSGDKKSGNWPGTEMTAVTGLSGYYSCSSFSGVPEKVVFTNNSGSQTSDLGFVDGAIYTKDGKLADVTKACDEPSCDKTPVFTMQSNVNDAVTNVAKSISVTGTSNCASYQWSVTSSNASKASFSASTSATTNFTATAAGTYTVKMTATSDCGNTTEKTCTITVSAPACDEQVFRVYSTGGTPNFYAWGGNVSTSSYPGTAMTAIAGRANWYQFDLGTTSPTGNFLINIGGDGNKSGNLDYTTYCPCTCWQYASNKLTEIECPTPAASHNASYTNPSNGTFKLNNGTTTPISVGEGSTYTVKLTAASGYEATSIKMNGVEQLTNFAESDGVYTYTRTMGAANEAWTATMAAVQYSVTYAACSSGNGSVSGTVASGSKQNPGTEVTLTATPDEGYYLRGWYSDAAGTNRLAYAQKTDEYQYAVTLDANKTVYAKFEQIPTGLKLDGNLCGRDWGSCKGADTYSGGVYTWTWTSVTNADKEFCIKNSTCNDAAVVKPNTAGVTFDGTNCTIADGGDPNHNFKISHEVGDLTVTLTYGSGIHVNATKAADELATGWYLAGSMNTWSSNNASYQFKLDPDHKDQTIGYLTLHLNSNVDFKISNGTTLFANKAGEDNSGTMTVDNCTDWTFDKTSVSGNHTTLRTNGEGDYTFVLNYTTKEVSVIYPNNRYIKSSWNNSWGTAAKMTYNAGTYTLQYKSVPASANHQFVFCYADKGDMYHADASGVDMSHSTTTLSDGSDHNFTFATNKTGDITITLTESGGTKDVRVAFSGKVISNLTVEVYHNYDGSNWTGRTLTTKEGDNYVQTAPFYSTRYYQLRVDGATIVNQPASNLPGAGECIDGENAKWVYNPHTEILSVQPLGSRHVIYFQNTVEWDDVFVYFYSDSYWNDTKGSGAQSGGNYLGVHQMTHVGDGLYSYTFTGTLPAVVCFAKWDQDDYEFFDDNECAYAGAFAEANNLYTPNPENPDTKNVHGEHSTLYYSGAWGAPTEYQVVVTMNNHIEYTSNKVMRTGKTVSFFAPQDGDVTYAGGTVELRANGVKVGENITGFAVAGVYVATVNNTGDGLVDIAPYTGDYYVRSACVGGDGLMTFFERRPTETYSYYKCLFSGDSEVDVKATVANDYNENLSTMIGVDKFTTAQGKVLKGNVRYSYEPTTNDFRRAVIGGSTISNKFLNVVGDYIYKEEGLTTLLNQAHYNSTPADSKFDDISDWVYEKTIYVNITNPEDASDVVVMSLFNSQTDYLLGYEKDPVTGYDTDNPRQLTVVGANSSSGVYKIRIIYDYKRNRLLSAWSPADITISSSLQINADVMFVRHEDNDAAQIDITHGSGATVSSLKSVMFVLEMENDGKNSANYWLSLPYDCQISDIFGVDGYGTLWAIQRYDGESRSHGWYAHDTETFWTWMDRDEVLHAGEGYVLTFVKKNAHWSNVKIDGVDRSILRLYFPSREVGFTMSEAEGSALTKTFEPMICNLIVKDKDGNVVERGDRRALDSNWRLIGPMSYNNITIATFTASEDADEHWYNENTPPHFLYEYLGKSATAHQRYSVISTERYIYHSFHSYMTQYAGTITWVPYTQAVSSVAARRVESEGFTHTNMCLNLIQNDTVVLDRTYVSLDQHATNGYDQNLDLTKITDSKRSQIYSVSGDAYAGNTLPLETDTVALTINAASAGDYVISMPEPNNDVEPMLYDAEMGMTTPLNLSDYTITLSKGTHADRFYLVLGRKTPGVATEIQNVNPSELNLSTDMTQKLLINGEVYLLRDGYIYDAIGRRVR